MLKMELMVKAVYCQLIMMTYMPKTHTSQPASSRTSIKRKLWLTLRFLIASSMLSP